MEPIFKLETQVLVAPVNHETLCNSFPAIDTITRPVKVNGLLTKITEKSWGVLTDEDGITRYLPFSRCYVVEQPELYQPCTIYAPRWLLKQRRGGYPEWVKGKEVQL